MEQIKHIIKAKIVSDHLFVAKIMYAIDIRVQRWLEQCKGASSRCAVDDRIIDFREIISDIGNCRFNIELPPSFTQPTVTPRMIDDSNPGRNPRKRKGLDEKENENKKRMVNNENQLEEFNMIAGETWKGTFCGKCVEDCPNWSGTKVKMCPRWHSKGDCFSDCRDSESHVPDSSIPDGKKTAFRGYLKKIRRD